MMVKRKALTEHASEMHTRMLQNLVQDFNYIHMTSDCWTTPGTNLEEYYYGMLEKLGLVRQHGHVTVDSGSNNKALFEAFEAKLDVTFVSDQMMHRCMGHVINLVARDGLKVFGHVEEDEEDVKETYIMRIAAIVNKSDGAHVDISTVYERIKNMAKRINSSTQRKEQLACAVTLQQPNSKVNGMIGDVTTKRNSTYMMFKRALQLR
ncbi:hypothetical protein DD238_008308 [Peronospora effusa]|uniref:Uncharacterized protein n=2 Tax=Peronospora effusa TaxID=542832 RepID=A0A3M6V6X2_9STRA|nr:hypothetical protein DD238_008308 [Peronospora effusa]